MKKIQKEKKSEMQRVRIKKPEMIKEKEIREDKAQKEKVMVLKVLFFLFRKLKECDKNRAS